MVHILLNIKIHVRGLLVRVRVLVQSVAFPESRGLSCVCVRWVDEYGKETSSMGRSSLC